MNTTETTKTVDLDLEEEKSCGNCECEKIHEEIHSVAPPQINMAQVIARIAECEAALAYSAIRSESTKLVSRLMAILINKKAQYRDALETGKSVDKELEELEQKIK